MTGKVSDRASTSSADAIEKVTGAAVFVSDIELAGMLHGKVLRSPLPHARIRAIDASAALDLAGVQAVLTGEDLAPLDAHWGPYFKDRPVVAIDKVRYVGDPVAAVAAESEAIAEEALDLIAVDYDELPFVTEAEEAAAPGAPLVHDDFEVLEDFYFKGRANPVPGTNVFQSYAYEHGEAEAALAAAAHVFEDTYTFPMVFHYAMEPHTVVADYDGDGFTLWSCAQSPAAVQKTLSRIFRMPQSKIRVISPFVGGGFGGKASVKIDPLVAALAWKAGRPVRVRLSLEESMLTCRRLGARLTIRTGVDPDGKIVTKSVRALLDGGAYADTGPAVAIKAVTRAIGPYDIPNLKLESTAVYTNTVPGAAFRSIGGPQGVWAAESEMDVIAQRLGLDPMEVRSRNLLGKGGHVRPDLRPLDVDMAAMMGMLSQVVRQPAWDAEEEFGMALAATDPGVLLASTALLRLKADGSALVLAGSVEIGQGVRNVLRNVAADALGVAVDRVSVAKPDTDTSPFDWGTGASRSTVVMGLAVESAARDVLRQIGAMAADAFGMDAAAVRLTDAGVSDGRQTRPLDALFQAIYGVDSGEVIGQGVITPRAFDGKLGQAPLFWETSAGACVLDVDEETGRVRVERYVSVAEVGKVLNPAGAEGQDEGAAVQGLGHALYEELRYANGQPINFNAFDYHVPRIDEAPEELVTILLESGDGPGPGGARGMGEGGILPMAPAIANALARGYGIRIHDLPITPERVWRALRARKDAD